MGRGKGAALLLAPIGLIAGLVWLLGADDTRHAGHRTSLDDREIGPGRTTTSENPASSQSNSVTTIGGENHSTELSEPPEQRDVVIFCTIDGVPGLPKRFELDGTPLIDRTDDPVGGVIRGRYEAGSNAAEFGMRSSGLVGGGLRANLAGAPALIELSRAVRVTLRIEAPDEFARHVDLQRFHGLRWMQSEASTDIGHDEDTELLTIREFTAGMGRYRVVLPGPIVLKELEVLRGSGPVTVPIDLRRAGWVKFEVILPHPLKPPTDPHAVRFPDRQVPQGPHSIRIAGPGVESPARVPNTRRFVHPGDRGLRFTLSGAQLAPHPVRGTATMHAGGAARLEAVGKATAITFDWPGDVVNPRLFAYRLPRSGPPEHISVRLYYETYRFFGMQGTHDYVIWARGTAPVVLRGLDVDGSISDLGMLKPATGQTLRIQPADLAESDLVSVYAYWTDPEIWLGGGTMFRASPTAELRGLPSGTIRLKFFARGKAWTHDYESSGEGRRTISIQLPDR